MNARFDELSLWICPEDRRVTFRGRLLASSRGRPSLAGVTPEVSIYADLAGGYVVALGELLPEELSDDDLERVRNLKDAYGGSWFRSTVTYAGRFSTLEAMAETDLERFTAGGEAGALADAIRDARDAT
jgi:hypothetical protein